MLFELEFEIELSNFILVGEVFFKIKEILKKFGVKLEIFKKVVIVFYEVEMNIVIYFVGGILKVIILKDKIEVIV